MLRGLGKEQGEFLAAEARGRVDAPAEPPHLGGEGLEHLVAGRMSELVVHPLEVVEVRDQQAHRMPCAPAPVELHRQQLLKAAAIAQLGQGIGMRGVREARDQPLGVGLEQAHEHAHQQHGAHGDRPLLLGARAAARRPARGPARSPSG